jgi:hypothetical protein
MILRHGIYHVAVGADLGNILVAIAHQSSFFLRT